ncbi:hypothetical protein Tco_0575003 [Tanacetum coccineum]
MAQSGATFVLYMKLKTREDSKRRSRLHSGVQGTEPCWWGTMKSKKRCVVRMVVEHEGIDHWYNHQPRREKPAGVYVCKQKAMALLSHGSGIGPLPTNTEFIHAWIATRSEHTCVLGWMRGRPIIHVPIESVDHRWNACETSVDGPAG